MDLVTLRLIDLTRSVLQEVVIGYLMREREFYFMIADKHGRSDHSARLPCLLSGDLDFISSMILTYASIHPPSAYPEQLPAETTNIPLQDEASKPFKTLPIR